MAQETRIGLGLAALGRPDYINIRTRKDIDKSVDAFKANTLHVLDKAYDLGIRDFDVAPSYGLGESFLLDWTTSRAHKDIRLSTKFGYTYVANWEVGFKGKHEIKEHSLSKLNEQWQVSKSFLPHLKIYQIHSATLDSGVLKNEAVLSRLHELKHNYQLQIGLSSSGTEQTKIIEEAQNIKFDGVDLFDSYQVTFNILEQSTMSILKEVLVIGKTVIIKEALANGRVFRHSNFENYGDAYDVLEHLKDTYGVGIDAIAIRYIINALRPSVVLSGASNTAHLEQNLGAMKFKLSNSEIHQLGALAISPQAYWDERQNLKWH